MNNLSDILGVNLLKDTIFSIDEEKLLLLKSEDYYVKSDLYFYLQNQLFKYKNDKKEYAYINYLISYYLMVVLTPLSYEELAYNYIMESLLISNDTKYKEWALIFATLERPLLEKDTALSFANEVLKENPSSNIANTINLLFSFC